MENIIISKKARKRRASVFDQYIDQTKHYLSLGISLRTIFHIISKDMSFEYSYVGFYVWAKKKNLSISTRKKISQFN